MFGLPLPSNDPVFIVVVVIHIVLSFGAVLFGLIAMLKDKSSVSHSKFGRFYYWSTLSAFVTVVALVVLRWPHNNHLLLIGAATVSLVFFGRLLTKHKPSKWPRLHAIVMGSSYILLLTGFYVDNGEHLPFWNQFPQWVFWIFPTVIGLPIILFVIKMHPMTKS